MYIYIYTLYFTCIVSSDEIIYLQKAFSAVDTTNSGSIDKEQMARAFGMIGIHCNEFVFHHVFGAFAHVQRLYNKTRQKAWVAVADHLTSQIDTVEMEPYLLACAILIRGTDMQQADCTSQLYTCI